MTGCAHMVHRNFHNYPCSRRGAVERDGRMWCKQHDPEAVAARNRAQSDRYDREIAARRADTRKAGVKACIGFLDEQEGGSAFATELRRRLAEGTI